jgi:hypothetical protein
MQAAFSAADGEVGIPEETTPTGTDHAVDRKEEFAAAQ